MKKFLSVLLTAIICITSMAISVYAVAPSGIWTDYAADSFAEGTGTKTDPYIILTPEQLAKIAKDTNDGTKYIGKYFELGADIDLSGHIWEGIDKGYDHNFGSFIEGNGHKITGLYVDETSDGENAGFIGTLYNYSTNEKTGVANLIIEDAEIYTSDANTVLFTDWCLGGILAAKVDCAATYISPVFENITVSGKIVCEDNYGGNTVGGLVGDALNADFYNCHVEDITITGACGSGGFAGQSCKAYFENCTAKGSIEGGWALGGFVGFSYTDLINNDVDPRTASSYTYCYADVDITGYDWNLGGFVGEAECSVIKNCVALGDVHSDVDEWAPRVGGFAGRSLLADIKNSHASGKVTNIHPDIPAGGFVGCDDLGMTSDSSFDAEKNPTLNAVGDVENEGTHAIDAETTQQVLSNICNDYYNAHQFGADLKNDTDVHYYECVRCGEKKDEADHSYENTCDTDCEDCGYTREIIHSFTELKHDENKHWNECICGISDNDSSEDHKYDNSVDADCNVCGYVRTLILDASTVDTTSVFPGYALEKSIITGTLNGVDGTWQWRNPETIVNETGTYTAVFTPNGENAESVEVEIEVKTCCFLCHSENIIARIFCTILTPIFKLFGLQKNCPCGDVHYTESVFDMIVALFNK